MTRPETGQQRSIELIMVEDSVVDAELVVDALLDAGLAASVRRVEDEPAFRAALNERLPDAILADWTLPHFSGRAALGIAHERCPELPFIFVSGTLSETAAIEALRQGATDYVYKHQLQQLGPALIRALDETRARRSLREQYAFQESLLESMPIPVYFKDRQGIYLGCNRAFEDMIDKRRTEIIGKSVFEIWPPEIAEKYQAMDQQLFDRPGTQIYESVLIGADEKIRNVVFHKATFQRTDGSVGGLIGVIMDITERKQAEESVRIAATAFESQEGKMVTNANGVILRVNCAFTIITGYTAEEVIGKNPCLLSSGRHDASFYAAMWQQLTNIGAWQGEIWNRRKSGELYLQWLTITAVKNDAAEVTNYVASMTDITARKAAEDEINHLAFYDPLTALPNRRLLLDRLEQVQAASSRHKSEGALLFIDLDNFKDLNDNLGHHVGDLLLQQVAQRLTTCVREGDTVARLGGDEFVVVLKDLDDNVQEAATQAKAVGNKILDALHQTFQLADSEYYSSASIGVTLFDGPQQESVENLLKQADLAMYQAKAYGRNTLRFFDPEMQTVVTARAALEAGLREAVMENQFILYYQAQVTGKRQLLGAEVLVRWRHPQRGIVSPAEFIPVAEATGLILPLGHWVLEAACTQLGKWAAQPSLTQLCLAVNVSANQFRQADFVDQVVAVLLRTGANPQRLKLELTESLLVSNLDDVIAKMTKLKAMGVGLSLDDFGTGYSSLSYLKRLPLDQLKIDQAFVKDILIGPNDAAIAKMVVALGDSLGLVVIAEGVETEAQRDFLAREGCHAYQGYLFSRPAPLEEFEAFAKRH
jgi:diguanylate cyclase (GGDEF)-like protein/PAS domain S-box-containing protein